MAHKSKPRDSAGGSRGCGGNLMAGDVPVERESFLRRNARAVVDFVFAFKATRQMSRKNR